MRTKTSKKVLIILALIFMLINSVAFADNFNKSTHYYRYSGGFNKNFVGSNGKHWTKYSIFQPVENGGVWSQINVAGRGKDYSAGDQYSYALSRFSVDFYHQHTHSHGDLHE